MNCNRLDNCIKRTYPKAFVIRNNDALVAGFFSFQYDVTAPFVEALDVHLGNSMAT
jgi:hypothetical protein